MHLLMIIEIIMKLIKSNSINVNHIILFYGKNEGLKNEVTLDILIKGNNDNIRNYDEKEISDNENNFIDEYNCLNLFLNMQKFIVIKRDY